MLPTKSFFIEISSFLNYLNCNHCIKSFGQLLKAPLCTTFLAHSCVNYFFLFSKLIQVDACCCKQRFGSQTALDILFPCPMKSGLITIDSGHQSSFCLPIRKELRTRL